MCPHKFVDSLCCVCVCLCKRSNLSKVFISLDAVDSLSQRLLIRPAAVSQTTHLRSVLLSTDTPDTFTPSSHRPPLPNPNLPTSPLGPTHRHHPPSSSSPPASTPYLTGLTGLDLNPRPCCLLHPLSNPTRLALKHSFACRRALYEAPISGLPPSGISM